VGCFSFGASNSPASIPAFPARAPRVGIASAARVSIGSFHDTWNGVANKTPRRDPSQHITITVVVYNTIAAGVPSASDVIAAVEDLERLYASTSVNPETLAGPGHDYMKDGIPCAPPTVPMWQTPAAKRKAEEVLFTPAVRRDIYRILCAAPRGPLVDSASVPSAAGHAGMCRPPLRWAARSKMANAFLQCEDYELYSRKRDSTAATPDDLRMNNLIMKIGSGVHITATEAFEKLLMEEYIPWWTDKDVQTLSTAFVVAFGNELGGRFDIAHRIKAQEMTHADISWIRSLPAKFNGNVIPLLDTFQTSNAFNWQ